MRQITFASLIVLGLTATAFANEVPIPSGRFEGITPGYQQTFGSWTVRGANPGDPAPTGNTNLDPGINLNAPALPASASNADQLISGVFNSYSSYLPTGSNNFVAMVNNLGVGTAVLENTSAFLVSDDVIQFNYAYLTGDGPDASTTDQLSYQIDFFSDSGGTVNTGTTGPIALQSTSTDLAFVGASPFNISTTYTGTHGPSGYAVEFLDISSERGSYARITFTIDNANATSLATNGWSVSGLVLDNVVLVPEPGSFALFGLGVLGFGGLARRRRRKLAAK